MSKFFFKTTDESNFTNVFFEGPINETFNSFDLQVNRDKSVRFDFKKVSVSGLRAGTPMIN